MWKTLALALGHAMNFEEVSRFLTLALGQRRGFPGLPASPPRANPPTPPLPEGRDEGTGRLDLCRPPHGVVLGPELWATQPEQGMCDTDDIRTVSSP